MAIADFAVIGIVVISGLVAFSLGVVWVALGLGGWIGAGLITLYGFTYVRPFAHRWIDSALFADIAAGATLFVVSLILLTLIGHAIAERVRDSSFGALDRSLGMVTGLVLGAVLVCICFIMVERLTEMPRDHAKRPDWIRDAKSAPIVEWGAHQLIMLLPSEWREDTRTKASSQRESQRKAQKTAERLAVPKPSGAEEKEKSGYSESERREMDRLMNTRQ